MTRRSRSGDADRGERPSRRDEQPPQLKLRLWQRIKLLLILNALPLLAAAWMGYHAYHGRLQLTVEAAPLAMLVGAILAACAAILLALWVVLPIGRWLAAYPTWHFQRRSALIWALPTLIGHVLAFLMAAIVVGIIALAIVVIVIGVKDMTELEQSDPSAVTAPATGVSNGAPAPGQP